MHCSSPRAKAGLSILDASIAPCELPAPITVCSSSMNKITDPSDFRTSSITAFMRSSNSPRNFEPATIAPISSESTDFPLRISGTSLFAIRWASPSTMAVLPTPASPIRTGLFFVLLHRTCIMRVISLSLPITGSSFPSRAICVRSLENFSRALRLGLFFALGFTAPGTAPLPARFFIIISKTFTLVIPYSESKAATAVPFSFRIAKNRCSVPINSSPRRLDSA